VATDSKPPLCDAWSCVNGEVVGPYDTPMLCGKCKGTGRLPAPEEWPNATPHPAGEPDRLAEPVQSGAEAVAWQIRNRYHGERWGRWRETSREAYEKGAPGHSGSSMDVEYRALYAHPPQAAEPVANYAEIVRLLDLLTEAAHAADHAFDNAEDDGVSHNILNEWMEDVETAFGALDEIDEPPNDDNVHHAHGCHRARLQILALLGTPPTPAPGDVAADAARSETNG
jgi:hypothetical protein